MMQQIRLTALLQPADFDVSIFGMPMLRPSNSIHVSFKCSVVHQRSVNIDKDHWKLHFTKQLNDTKSLQHASSPGNEPCYTLQHIPRSWPR